MTVQIYWNGYLSTRTRKTGLRVLGMSSKLAWEASRVHLANNDGALRLIDGQILTYLRGRKFRKVNVEIMYEGTILFLLHLSSYLAHEGSIYKSMYRRNALGKKTCKPLAHLLFCVVPSRPSMNISCPYSWLRETNQRAFYLPSPHCQQLLQFLRIWNVVIVQFTSILTRIKDLPPFSSVQLCLKPVW